MKVKYPNMKWKADPDRHGEMTARVGPYEYRIGVRRNLLTALWITKHGRGVEVVEQRVNSVHPQHRKVYSTPVGAKAAARRHAVNWVPKLEDWQS